MARQVRQASAGAPLRDEPVRPIAVVPLMKGDEILAFRIFTSMDALVQHASDLNQGGPRALQDTTLLDHSASYSEFFRLDRDGKSFRPIGSTNRMTGGRRKFELDVTGVAVIDVPQDHDLFTALDRSIDPKSQNMFFMNDPTDKNNYRLVFRPILATLQEKGFLPGRPSNVTQFRPRGPNNG